MKTPERKIITRLDLREISAVDQPAMAGALVKIMKSADPAALTAPVAFHRPTEAGEQQITKMLAAIRGETITKSHNEEDRHMSETNYDRLVKSHAQRTGVSIAKAAEKLMEDDRQALADAYDADEREAARRYAENDRSN